MASISKILQSCQHRVCLLALLVFAGLALLAYFHVGQTLENHALDLCYRLRSHSPPPKELVIIAIDEQSFQALHKAWPWPRRYHARLIRKLKAAGARLIVFDVLFAEPSDPEDDQMLAEAMRQAGNVILGTTLEISESPQVSRMILVQPLPLFRQAALGLGLTLVTPDVDGIVHRFQCNFEVETIPVTVARHYFPNISLPPDCRAQYLIHYTGPDGRLNAIPYSQALEAPVASLAPQVRGKIVLIGRIVGASPDPRAQADAFYTPFFANTNQLMSGVEIHAQVIQTLLHHSWGRELGALPQVAIYFIVLVLFGWLVVRVSPFAAIYVLAGFILLIFGLSFLLFLHLNFWFPPVLLSGGLVVVYAGHIFAHSWLESREKRWLRQVFGQYVSESLVESIIANPERLQLAGEEIEATVLFADLVGFSSMAENTAPKELIRFLNDYFSTMTEIIQAHGGTVDKFIGDAIMAFWGAPLPVADHARLACETALEMQEAMKLLRENWQAQGFPAMATRIGVHTGPVVAGNVGSKKRFNYTVVGDTVNLTSRLEQANKVYGTRIILSEATYRRLNNSFLVRELDLVQVRGRAQPVTIYELLDFQHLLGPPRWVTIFAEGRAAYCEGNIGEAATRFHEILAAYCDDPPSQVYLQRCQKYLDKPQLSEWQGPFVLDNK